MSGLGKGLPVPSAGRVFRHVSAVIDHEASADIRKKAYDTVKKVCGLEGVPDRVKNQAVEAALRCPEVLTIEDGKPE